MKEALIFLIDTFTRLYLLILLLRFWLPLLRVNFRNPVAQGILRYTSPAVVPFRRYIPSFGQIDTATIVVAILIQLAASIVITVIGTGFGFFGQLATSLLPMVVAAFFELARMSVVIFIVSIVVRVILSLLGRGFGPMSDLLFNMTEPMLRPVRRLIPPLGVIDLSAYIVIILLFALNMVLADIQSQLM